jgi:hypothetical protein
MDSQTKGLGVWNQSCLLLGGLPTKANELHLPNSVMALIHIYIPTVKTLTDVSQQGI